MLTAQLTGGLGNQLFTYARLALRAKELGIELCIDGSVAERVLGRYPDLFDFKLMNESKKSAVDYSVIKTQLERALWRTSFTRNLSKRYQQEALGSQVTFPENIRGWKVRGFFQDFEIARDFIDAFSKNPLSLKFESRILEEYTSNLEFSNTLGIHMRRGDYLNYKDSYGVLSDEYYVKALHKALEKYDFDRIMIFTDSPNLVRDFSSNMLLPAEIVTAQELSTSETLILMSRCMGLITSNSTFSFWAAALSDHNKVLTPFPWFKSKDAWLSSSNLNNPNWIKCEAEWQI